MRWDYGVTWVQRGGGIAESWPRPLPSGRPAGPLSLCSFQIVIFQFHLHLLSLSAAHRQHLHNGSTIWSQGSNVGKAPLIPPASTRGEGEEESKGAATSSNASADRDMSDLPGWAKGDGEPAPSGDLADKLVDEAAGVKPAESADAAAAAAAAAEASVSGSDRPHEDSGLASRALCFFRLLAVLTVLLAFVVIGTNCYIIYDKYNEIKGEFGAV